MPKLKNAIFASIIVLGAIGFFMTGRAPASSADAVYEGEPEIVAATFASAWCSACKILKPRLVNVIPEFSEQPVSFMELDFTFGVRDEHAALAAENGFTELFENNKGSTGFTLLIDPVSGETIDILTMNHSEKAMRAAIAQAIAVASRDAGDGADSGADD